MRREICLQLNQAATNAWELAELTPVQVIQGVSRKGNHPMNLNSMMFFLILLFASSASGDLYLVPERKDWLISFEGGLGIGNMDHTFSGMEMELFGVDTLRRGGEQDGIGIRAGLGKRMSHGLTPVVYGGMSTLFPGVFFDNHGPFIPPELCYMLKEKSLGLELRYSAVRAGVGYSFYSGTVSLHPDKREGAEEGEEWEGKLENTSGPHILFGFSNPVNDNISVGVDLIWRSIRLQFPEAPTGVTPEEITRAMIEVRLSLQISTFAF